MNIYKLLAILAFILHASTFFAQDENKRLQILNIHVGVGASNLINAEAPHKIINLDDSYHLVYSNEPGLNYQTYFWKDIKYSFVGGLSFEYALKSDLSLLATLNYEGKGIAIDYMFEEKQLETEPMWVQKEDYTFDIANHYITMPIGLRKYLNPSSTFYIQGGCYLAYLLQSTVDISMEGAYVSSMLNESVGLTNVEAQNSYYGIELNEDDFDKELTSQLDFGVYIGTGINYPISDKLYINADLSFGIGLRNIDGENNNDYSEVAMPLTTGYSSSISSANYYGLNSKAKNISGALTVGIGFKL